MSLLSELMESCILMDKRTTSDGYGGYITSYVPGAEFEAAIVRDSSLQARVAEKQGVKDLFTITTKKVLKLAFGDVFQRQSDGKYFKVTTNNDDRKTPECATLDMRQVNAEEYSLAGGVEDE
jgi:uncharacterized protein YdbL (DUF1318 family)